MRRLKHSEIILAKQAIFHKQGHVCPLCMTGFKLAETCQDHDHKTGRLRGVLCRNCNGIEGKIANLITRAKRHSTGLEWLGRYILYHLKHATDQTGLLHPLHKTEDEKRLVRNTKARKVRAAKATK